MARVHCSAQTTAENVVQKLLQVMSGCKPLRYAASELCNTQVHMCCRCVETWQKGVVLLLCYLLCYLWVLSNAAGCLSLHPMWLQVCGKPVTTVQGKCLRPDTGRVILYLQGINLPK